MWTVGTKTKVIVVGVEKEVNTSAPFAETITNLAKEAGITKFAVYADGQEVTPSNAPASFENLNEVRIVPYGEVG